MAAGGLFRIASTVAKISEGSQGLLRILGTPQASASACASRW